MLSRRRPSRATTSRSAQRRRSSPPTGRRCPPTRRRPLDADQGLPARIAPSASATSRRVSHRAGRCAGACRGAGPGAGPVRMAVGDGGCGRARRGSARRGRSQRGGRPSAAIPGQSICAGPAAGQQLFASTGGRDFAGRHARGVCETTDGSTSARCQIIGGPGPRSRDRACVSRRSVGAVLGGSGFKRISVNGGTPFRSAARARRRRA